MIHYKNHNCFSSIKYYDYGKDWIRIELVTGENRTYTHEKSGKSNVRKMKRFAKRGKGLGSFIESNKAIHYIPDKSLMISIGCRSTPFRASQIIAV